ncbi:MAG TPA: hypothetical protein VIN06_04655 [Devosia sp.]
MKLHTVVSTLAVAAAMTFSGSAMAQSAVVMVDGLEIPSERMPDFESKCAAIASAQTESLAAPVENETDATETGSTSSPDTDDPDPANEDNLDALLASITVDQCKEAGLVKGPVPATTQ